MNLKEEFEKSHTTTTVWRVFKVIDGSKYYLGKVEIVPDQVVQMPTDEYVVWLEKKVEEKHV